MPLPIRGEDSGRERSSSAVEPCGREGPSTRGTGGACGKGEVGEGRAALWGGANGGGGVAVINRANQKPSQLATGGWDPSAAPG